LIPCWNFEGDFKHKRSENNALFDTAKTKKIALLKQVFQQRIALLKLVFQQRNSGVAATGNF